MQERRKLAFSRQIFTLYHGNFIFTKQMIKKSWMTLRWILIFVSIMIIFLRTQAQFWSTSQTFPILSWNEQSEISFDLINDTSFQKFLDETHPFQNPNYEPSDLAPIPSDFTSNSAKKFQLRAKAGTQFADMAWHFWDHFKKKKRLTITSAYRSYAHQQQLQKNFCRKNQCAEPWSSEHQAGLAIDIGQNGKRFDKASLEWMQENAHKRGFHQTYQKWPEIDWKMIEPRHWRYVGKELATELYEKQLSFRQWFYEQENKKLIQFSWDILGTGN